MIAGDLALADLPAAWNEGMRALLGIAPPDDRRGCLQDIHWYDGALGYFPTYTLGAMTAAQLFDAARRADPAIAPASRAAISRRSSAGCGRHVHGQGSRFPTAEMVARATGTAARWRHLRAPSAHALSRLSGAGETVNFHITYCKYYDISRPYCGAGGRALA